MNNMQTYPVLLQPVGGAKLLMPSSPRGGKNKKKGASELVDMARIFRVGLKEIREDVCAKIDGHNYEPDFAYIDKRNGICIDIEVDEPYSTKGIPTHYLLADGTNIDSKRNERFQNAGWYVCRFSEHQIFCHTKSCMKEVYKILLTQGVISELPKKLASAPDLQPDDRWNETDSRRLSKENYRTSYLGYNPCKMDFRSNMQCIWLTLPMLGESIWNNRLRIELFRQLNRYFFKK